MIDRQTDEIRQKPPLNMMFNMYVMNNIRLDRRKPEEESRRQWRCDPEKERKED